jgi:hypothetical protein
LPVPITLPAPINEAPSIPEPIAAELPPITEQPLPIASRSPSSRLDQLIHNELRIREERIEIPEQIVLQGRIVPQPVFRVDRAATPLGHGPHFETDRLPADDSISSMATGPEIESATGAVDGSHPTGPSKPHFMRRQPGRNTIAVAATSTSSSTPMATPELKTSETPLTDALRQLQGGLS